MKKRISFRLFCTVVWRGVCQAAGQVGRLFGYRTGDTWGKVVWRLLAGSVTAVVVLFSFCVILVFCREVVIDRWLGPALSPSYWEDRHISNDIVFQWRSGRSRAKRIYDEATGKVLMRNVDWVAVSDDRDSLAVFAKNGKRGYLDRFTGEVVIPAEYTRAWVFSEGLAAVEKDGRLMFIDHSGKVVIDNDFEVHFDKPKYAFQNGCCILREPVHGKMGLIDREGSWVLQPVYDNIYGIGKFWKVEKDGLAGLFTAGLDTLFTVSHTGIQVLDGIIKVVFPDHTAKLYDYEGNIVEDFHIDGVSDMVYETTELTTSRGCMEDCGKWCGEDFCEDGTCGGDSCDGCCGSGVRKVYAVASCRRYIVNGGRSGEYCGLMDRKGHRLTPPSYISIEAIGEDLYLCRPAGIILDGKGKKVE